MIIKKGILISKESESTLIVIVILPKRIKKNADSVALYIITLKGLEQETVN